MYIYVKRGIKELNLFSLSVISTKINTVKKTVTFFLPVYSVPASKNFFNSKTW